MVPLPLQGRIKSESATRSTFDHRRPASPKPSPRPPSRGPFLSAPRRLRRHPQHRQSTSSRRACLSTHRSMTQVSVGSADRWPRVKPGVMMGKAAGPRSKPVAPAKAGASPFEPGPAPQVGTPNPPLQGEVACRRHDEGVSPPARLRAPQATTPLHHAPHGPPPLCRGGSRRSAARRHPHNPAAASMIGTNFAAVRLAPPTSAPSTSGVPRIAAALSPTTDPP